MKKFIETLTNVWKIEELRNRIILTIGILLVYRFGAHIILPGIDAEKLSNLTQKTSEGGLLDILNAFTGGAFAKASVFALGIMPYISASIVVQLMGIAIPYLQKLQQEGESGRRRINQITRWLTIAICVVQAPAYLYSIGALGVPEPMIVIVEILLWLLVILGCIFLTLAVRQIPVQYARRTTGGQVEKNIFGARQYIPLKLNSAGVMPIIFAQAIMFVPSALAGLSKSEFAQSIQNAFRSPFEFWYNVLFGLLIIIFTYFYTAITVPSNKMADDLKRSGGFIPGVKPGQDTSDYLDKIMSLITLPGSLFLVAIAVLPAVVNKLPLLEIDQKWALFYGGTSLLILVGVAIDTMQQVNSYLLNRHYDGLMKTGKKRR